MSGRTTRSGSWWQWPGLQARRLANPAAPAVQQLPRGGRELSDTCLTGGPQSEPLCATASLWQGRRTSITPPWVYPTHGSPTWRPTTSVIHQGHPPWVQGTKSNQRENIPLLFYDFRDGSNACLWEWVSAGGSPLTVCGAATGSITGTVPHLDSLPSHFQQIWIRQAGFAGVAEPLLIVAPVVRDVDGRPGSPGCGLLQLGARVGVARLVLLGGKGHGMCLSCKHQQSPGFLLHRKTGLSKTSCPDTHPLLCQVKTAVLFNLGL